MLTHDGSPHSRESLRRAGLIPCAACGAILGQVSRTQDNVGDRELPVWRRLRWQSAMTDAAGGPRIPWGERPRSNPRIALGELIAKRYRGCVDLFICDEVHLMKGKTTTRGRIFGMLVEAAQRTLGMTGTLYGGKSSTVFSLLQRMGNTALRAEFDWDDEAAFVRQMGVIDTISREYQTTSAAQALRGKPTRTTTQVVERAGITAELAAVIQSQAVMILLKQMQFVLPKYHEGVVFLDLPPDLGADYATLVARGKAIVRAPGGRDALSSYLQATLTYALAPWNPVPVRSGHTGASYCPPAYPPATCLPHHDWLADFCAQAVRNGRRVLIFAEHTNRLDLLGDVQTKITTLAQEHHQVQLRVEILRSTTVKPGQRAAWFAAREADGTNVVLCHPALVETGLNLIGWPDIVFLEPTYKLACALQARKRAMRPTQTRDCTVTWLAYADTMMEQAMDVVGVKATAATLLTGDDLSSGQLQFDPGMSLLQELARRVLDDEDTTTCSTTAIQAQLQQAGEALRTSLQAGVADLVGIDPSVVLPAPSNALPGISVPALPAPARATDTFHAEPFLQLPPAAFVQIGLFDEQAVQSNGTDDEHDLYLSTADESFALVPMIGRWVSMNALPRHVRGKGDAQAQQAILF